MKIGELASSTGVSVETIRYYETEGLLAAPARTQGNYRDYDTSHVERLGFIRHCRSLDMALGEIRALLRFMDAPRENCDGVNRLLDDHIGHVAERIRELKALERQLRTLRARCHDAAAAESCGILMELAARSARVRTKTEPLHVARTHR